MSPNAYSRLEGFLREVLGEGSALLHEEPRRAPRLTAAADLGWSAALRAGFGFALERGHSQKQSHRDRSAVFC